MRLKIIALLQLCICVLSVSAQKIQIGIEVPKKDNFKILQGKTNRLFQ